MKRVCMIMPSFTAKGGIATVVSGYKNSKLEEMYDIHYIETYCDGNKMKKLLKAMSSYIKFSKEIIFSKPDIIHVHSSFGASFERKRPFIYMASWRKIPIINHIHGSDLSFYINASSRRKEKIKEIFDRCNYLIVLSDEWKEKFKIFNSKIPIVVENYSVLHEVNSEKAFNSEKSVLFLGFLSEAKGCFDIPLIIEKITHSIKNVKFILAGAGSKSDVQKIKELAKQYNIENYIHFPGWITGIEKDELLKKADVFFLPSYNEGMPMSILEAMGYGLPIISTNVGGIPQLVHQGENGFLFEPANIQGFSDAFIKLLLDDDMMLRMGKKSIEIVKQGYSLEGHLDKINAIYRKLI